MDLASEGDSEFWTSLNLISTQPDDDNEFNENLTPCIRKSVSSANVVEVKRCRTLETQSLPITSIISRIQAEDSGSDEESEKSAHPPPSYTGGKWKPTVSQSLLSLDDSNVIRKETPITDEPTGDSFQALNDVHEEEEIRLADLTCVICERTFSKTENLVVHLTSQKHRQNITGENRHIAAQLYTHYHSELVKRSAYQCACCTFAAIEHNGLITHMKSQQHSENVSKLIGPLECVSCSFLDYDGSLMLAHCMSKEHCLKAVAPAIILKERRSQIKCIKCSKILHSTRHYSRHLKNQHLKAISADDNLKKCDYCPFQGKRSTVSQHISRTHRNKRPFACKVCQTDYSSSYDLCKHYSTRKHIDRVFDSYKQLITFGITPEVNLMVANESPVNQSAMRCHFCIFTTSELSKLHDHYTRLHEDEPIDDNVRAVPLKKPLFCRYCHKQLAEDVELFTHELNHIKKYLVTTRTDYNNIESCFICYADVDSSSMDNHQLQHNPYNRKHTVGEEGKSSSLSTGPSDGTYHMCTVSDCNRTYKSKADLNIHRATHDGGKLFACCQCDKSFSTRKQLKSHSTTHSSIKPFSCDYCDYKCKTRCHLQRHMRIHAGSKPYSCPYCEYSSTTIGNLRKHLLQSSKHKGLHMYECTQRGCHFVANEARAISEHLTLVHNISSNKIMMKSTENDWTDIIEGHSIIPAQH